MGFADIKSANISRDISYVEMLSTDTGYTKGKGIARSLLVQTPRKE